MELLIGDGDQFQRRCLATLEDLVSNFQGTVSENEDDRFYELCVSSQNSYFEASTPKMMVFGDETFER